ncbi:peptidoglycan editing factor PgeF [Geminicoccaceae bacterium 1502E]|nr:peptidoglycan editing factor PgeF [Geminicoccaceae bacterium 1502E]
MMIRAKALAVGGLRHAFFTREGGLSEGPFASLNMGLRSGDAPATVAGNRALAAAALEVEPSRLVTARQVHGTLCLEVVRPWPMEEAPDADALVTRERGLAIGVLSADCAPVLLADAGAGVVGAAHAGWKGALGGVLESVVAGMLAAGARLERIHAAVGPCIGRRSYEVGPELEARFVQADPASAGFFGNAGSRPHLDLEGYVAMRLGRAGVKRVEALGRDTCAEAERFFSYRRACLSGETRFGLQLSAIALGA